MSNSRPPKSGTPTKKMTTITTEEFKKSLTRLYDLPVKAMIKQQEELSEIIKSNMHSPNAKKLTCENVSARETESNDKLYYKSLKKLEIVFLSY